MNVTEIETLRKIALVFKNNQEAILENWTMAVKRDGITRSSEDLECFRNGFKVLLRDFSYYLSKKDLDGYYRGNKVIARQLANNDVSFSKFVKAFHLFEESYKDHLVAAFHLEDLVNALGTIDLLHHDTISLISEVYLDIKDVTVFALARLAELRDPETGHHLERTREYSATLAKHLGQSEHFVNLIYRVGPLHDIGKVGIRDSILLKPGPLTSSEYEEMKTHCVIGAETIQRIIDEQKVSNGYFVMAKEIILYHHEQYDGSGYPEGLRGCDSFGCEDFRAGRYL
ncbi:MAG: HD domain-containing protein [Chlorobiales bacterium]|nr:HD domain-containing protein [Chlorobiales bacterium]